MANVKRCSRQMIEKITQLVREKLELSTPVDLNEAVERLGGKCVAVSTDEYDAKIEKADSDYQFRVNYAKGQIETRQRFSIAHELGHLFLHMLNQNGKPDKVAYFRGKENNNSFAEWEANEFAASLLMPREEFINCCRAKCDENGNIDLNQVADHFKVSKQAAYVRGNVLDLW